jgi:hypothetical protein
MMVEYMGVEIWHKFRFKYNLREEHFHSIVNLKVDRIGILRQPTSSLPPKLDCHMDSGMIERANFVISSFVRLRRSPPFICLMGNLPKYTPFLPEIPKIHLYL